MHFDGLDLNLLVALDALLTERNVTRAAERLCVSQPAMSAALARLRLHLEDQLLERVGRKLELTPRARDLCGQVKDVLHNIRLTLRQSNDFDPTVAQRSFRISMSMFCGELIGVPFIKMLLASAPNIRCHINEIDSTSFTRLNDAEIDFCISLRERILSDPGNIGGSFCEEKLFGDEFVVITANSNKLSERGVSAELFAAMQFVEVRFGTLTSIAELEMRRQDKRPHVQAIVPNYMMAMSAVSESCLTTVVPRKLAEIHRERLGLRISPCPISMLHISEVLFWHPRNSTDPGHRWLRESLRSFAQGYVNMSLP